MTVKELIEKLKEMPQDAEVYYSDSFDSNNRITAINTEDGVVIIE